MTAESNLDLKGNFREHPFAELLVEIAHTRLAGSLRLTRGKQKAVVYFREGAVVYAVSNSRALRLFNILLQKKRVEQKDLADFPELANDIKLASGLVENGILTKQQID